MGTPARLQAEIDHAGRLQLPRLLQDPPHALQDLILAEIGGFYHHQGGLGRHPGIADSLTGRTVAPHDAEHMGSVAQEIGNPAGVILHRGGIPNPLLRQVPYAP